MSVVLLHGIQAALAIRGWLRVLGRHQDLAWGNRVRRHFQKRDRD
jgi:hypothetical protein